MVILFAALIIAKRRDCLDSEYFLALAIKLILNNEICVPSSRAIAIIEFDADGVARYQLVKK